jgi:glyoxalase family protein
LPSNYTFGAMRLEGIHHITAITGDALSNLDFYTRVLGLRLVKKTVNQDDPTVYHLFYGDEQGEPGLDLTFFEYRGTPAGRPGVGMVHTILWRVGSQAALDFWAKRLGEEEIEVDQGQGRLGFADPEGLRHELLLDDSADVPLVAQHPQIAEELALRGFAGVRAYSSDPENSRQLLEQSLGFVSKDSGWEVRGQSRGGTYIYDQPPDRPGVPGGGTVHHVAFASRMEDHPSWRERVLQGGSHPTEVIDRFYFRSIYFREPSGVLMEIATIGPGFSADEPLAQLGQRLSLPPAFEPARARIEQILPPLPDTQPWRTAV